MGTDDLKSKVDMRPIEPRDVDAMEAYFESLGEVSRAFFHPHPFDREHAERVCCDPDPETFRLVIESGKRIVGYAWFEPSQKSPYPVLGIAVSDDFQGRGLGGILMDALIGEARRRQHSGLRLTVYKDNERGIRLYKSRGFRICGEMDGQHAMDLAFDRQE